MEHPLGKTMRHVTGHSNPVIPLVAVGAAGAVSLALYAGLGPLALAVPAGALIAMAVLRFPWLTVATIAALVPFDIVRDLGGLPSPSKLAGVAGLGCLGLGLVLGRLSLRALASPLWPWLGVFVAVAGISALFSAYPDTARSEMEDIGVVVLTFVLSLAFVRDLNRVVWLTNLVILSIGLSAFLGVVGYIMDVPVFTMGLEDNALKRATGGSLDPNQFAMLVIFSIPLVVDRLRQARNGLWRALLLAILLTDLAGVVFSQSRSGFLVLVAVGLIMAWAHRDLITPRRLGLLLFAGAITLAAVAVLVPQDFWDRQATLLDSDGDRSLGRRTSYIYVAGDAVLRAPLLGHGPGTFPDLYAVSDYAPTFMTSYSTALRRYAHNTYLEVVTGMGALGLGLFLGFVARVLINLIDGARRFRRAGNPRAADLSQAWLIALIGMLLYMMVLSALTLKLLWIAAAVSSVLWTLSVTASTNGVGAAPASPRAGIPPGSGARRHRRGRA